MSTSVATSRGAANDAGGPITREEILSRSQAWIDERVLYNREGSHSDANGSYRSDGSGYVSMAWHLNHSYWSGDITSVTTPIAWMDLQPGDALWRHNPHDDSAQHITLFAGWADDARTAHRARGVPPRSCPYAVHVEGGLRPALHPAALQQHSCRSLRAPPSRAFFKICS